MRDDSRRFVQVIDLYSRQPAELERLLNRWRESSLAREHIAGVELGHDDADEQHLVLEVEYEPIPAPTRSTETVAETMADSAAETSAEAAGVVALLDRPPRFRATS